MADETAVVGEDTAEVVKQKFESKEDVVEAFGKNRDLVGADLSYMDLSGIVLAAGDMAGADLSHSQLTGGTLAGLNMEKANLSHVQMEGGLVAGVNLDGASMENVSMEKARFLGVNLGGANLSGADLRETTWAGTNVSGVDFSQANLDGARSSAVAWQSAKVSPQETPDSLIPPWLPLVLGGFFILLVILLIGKLRPKE